MKVPPKRKGNPPLLGRGHTSGKRGLNESPSEKEGKLPYTALHQSWPQASMKVPPKRKGNPLSGGHRGGCGVPQ